MTTRIIQRRAEKEIEAIRKYIARDNVGAADIVVSRIHEVIEHLVAFPNSGRKTRLSDVRMFAVHPYPYLIYFRYLPRRDELRVLRVLHAAQRRPELADDAVDFRYAIL